MIHHGFQQYSGALLVPHLMPAQPGVGGYRAVAAKHLKDCLKTKLDQQ